MKLKIGLYSGFFLFIFAVLSTGCAVMTGAKPTTAPTPQIQIDETRISASGEVVPARYASLGFVNGGQNVQLYASEGTSIHAGQVLASADSLLLKAAEAQALATFKRAELALETLESQPTLEVLSSARAALANAEAAFDRLDRANAEEIELDAAQAQIDAAEAALEALQAGPSRAQLDSTRADLIAARASLVQARAAVQSATITAPFDGEVIEVYLQAFENASPAQPVFLVADLSSLQVVTTDLSEVDASRLQAGNKVEVSFDALPDTRVEGIISRISLKTSSVSAANYTAVITLSELPAELRWGMTAFMVDVPK